jgi:acetyl-CoA carboxylase biotin carboxyl carrier protein
MTDELERPIESDVAAPAAPAGEATPTPTAAVNTGDASLLALIDRLGSMLERSDLTELEVEVGGTALVLRKPVTIAQPVAVAAGVDTAAAASAAAAAPAAEPLTAPSRPSIKAPLTGIWYGSPAPGSAPFVEAGREVAVGQVVGLIEAMKLFNEIKSELAGRVVRVVPESGALVKAKQPLIEVDPL